MTSSKQKQSDIIAKSELEAWCWFYGVTRDSKEFLILLEKLAKAEKLNEFTQTIIDVVVPRSKIN